MKKPFALPAALVLLLAVAAPFAPEPLRGWLDGILGAETPSQQEASASAPQTTDNSYLHRLIDSQRGGEMVQGQGTVTRVLKDDTEGSRHQRFILDIGAGKTLLVAHNIDLAPRLPGLQTGDIVRFYGQYETNHRDGILHWTHRDPNNRHEHGWLEYQGKRYQ